MRDKDRSWRRRKLARFSPLGVRILCSQGDRTPAAGDLTWTETFGRLTKYKVLPVVLKGTPDSRSYLFYIEVLARLEGNFFFE
jgi:hypothetical protein